MFGKRRTQKSGDVERSRQGELVEQLGDVVLSSGTLVVIDFGLLNFWSHSQPSLLEDGEPDFVEAMNASIDLEIVGPDAGAVAAAIDMAAVKGTLVFDVPANGGDIVRDRVAAVCSSKNLVAHVVPIDRMPHAERVARLVEYSPAGAEVVFNGNQALALSGLPAGQSLTVRGVRMPSESPDAGRWRSVWLELAESDVASSVEVGYVFVDEARLMFCDLDLLGEWEHNDSLDGLYDLAFWGLDAEEVAQATGAVLHPTLGQNVYGWVDIDLERTRQLAHQVFGLQEDGHLKFAADVRPHSHHHHVLRQTASSPTESGTIDLAAGRGVGFFTSWGDGVFPVYRDLDADGAAVRIRIEIGNDEIVARSRRMEELWFGNLAKSAVVSAAVVHGGSPIGYLFCEFAERENDSGWTITAGNESQEYLDDSENLVVVPLRELIGMDVSLEDLFSCDAPIAFERTPDGSFQECELPPVGD